MLGKLADRYPGKVQGWRKRTYWARQLRNKERSLTQVLGKGGKNRAERVQSATEAYLAVAQGLWDKIQASLPRLLSAELDLAHLAWITLLKHYHQLLAKHIDLVERRLLQGEKIPHQDKLFSIFEPHTEWINKGKKHKKVELGHNVLIATDQYHFILRHEVMLKQHDTEMAVPLARNICEDYQADKLGSISFDRGFYSGPNYTNLQPYAHQVILPKKGKKNQDEATREADPTFVKLRHKHSAVEANINQLEHHGLNRCPDKGLDGFKRYTALGVLAYNLHRLGKILIQQQQAKEKRKARKKAA